MTAPEIVAGRVRSIQVGAVAPLGPDAVPSGFVKRPTEGPAHIGLLGLAGDAQADLSVHGGPEKAVYAYPFAHYRAWADDFPRHAGALRPGAFGENLTIDGAVEADLCVGDVHAIGGAVLQVCQPRQPCFKLALRFDDMQLPLAMRLNGRAGWYYRVLEPGAAEAGDTLRLIDRPNPDFSFARLVAVISGRRASLEELAALADMTGLARDLRAWAARSIHRAHDA